MFFLSDNEIGEDEESRMRLAMPDSAVTSPRTGSGALVPEDCGRFRTAESQKVIDLMQTVIAQFLEGVQIIISICR